MYNRYIVSQGEDYFRPIEQSEAPPFEPDPTINAKEKDPKQGGIFANIKNMFGGKGEGGGLTFDIDTIFLLVLVYFLVMDSQKDEDGNKKPDDNIMETMLIVAALVLFGF